MELLMTGIIITFINSNSRAYAKIILFFAFAINGFGSQTACRIIDAFSVFVKTLLVIETPLRVFLHPPKQQSLILRVPTVPRVLLCVHSGPTMRGEATKGKSDCRVEPRASVIVPAEVFSHARREEIKHSVLRKTPATLSPRHLILGKQFPWTGGRRK
jgi:hypothetical protein